MNKRDFIQRAVINWMPVFKNDKDCIKRAEQVWSTLTEAGYGPTNEKTPDECKAKNWYSELQDQEAFDKCWAKYGREGARNDAAKAWITIEEQDKALIYPAVIKYLEDIKCSGITKAHFSTWLNQQRWLNYPEPMKKESRAAYDEKTQEIAHLTRQISMLPDGDTKEALKKQLERLSGEQ